MVSVIKCILYPEIYSTEDLETVTAQLRDSLNASGRLIDSLHIKYPDDKTVLNEAIGLYNKTQKAYPYLQYSNPICKKHACR